MGSGARERKSRGRGAEQTRIKSAAVALRNSAASLLFVSSVAACERAPEPAPPIRVAAAADLSAAFEELGRKFEEERGQKVTFSFGASGLLAKQLREGAPFDLFAAANASFVDQAVSAGACDGSTKAPYARGHLAVWSKRGSVAPAVRLEDLADPRFRKISIANPEHAPYGKAAKEALISAGIWEQVKGRLVFGENVRQALELAATGNAEVAVVALSLVKNDHEGTFFAVNQSQHRPIEQALAVCSRGSNLAGGKLFAEYVNSPAGREVLGRYGLGPPGEPTRK
jgi:molybdate transport system substrate-binding protein